MRWDVGSGNEPGVRVKFLDLTKVRFYRATHGGMSVSQSPYSEVYKSQYKQPRKDLHNAEVGQSIIDYAELCSTLPSQTFMTDAEVRCDE